MPRTRLRNVIRSLLLLLSTVALLLVAPSSAAARVDLVNRIAVASGGVRLVLDLDTPISEPDAVRHERELAEWIGREPPFGPISLGCSQGDTLDDARGSVTLERFCEFRHIRWLYRISPSVRAMIVGPVTETGLWYFINGVRQSRNSPHVEPADYSFHGTMPGVDTGQEIAYQDHLTFRHNLPPNGGAGSITFAGSIRLV
jgi:hypothetical protein